VDAGAGVLAGAGAVSEADAEPEPEPESEWESASWWRGCASPSDFAGSSDDGSVDASIAGASATSGSRPSAIS
jgi:hypothetical protein